MLRSMRYGEADPDPPRLHADAGRVGAIAKGVRRSRSRFGGRLEPFFRLRLGLHEGRGEPAGTVTSARPSPASAAARGYRRARRRSARLRRRLPPVRVARAPPRGVQPPLHDADAARRGSAGGRGARAPPGVPAETAPGRGMPHVSASRAVRGGRQPGGSPPAAGDVSARRARQGHYHSFRRARVPRRALRRPLRRTHGADGATLRLAARRAQTPPPRARPAAAPAA